MQVPHLGAPVRRHGTSLTSVPVATVPWYRRYLRYGTYGTTVPWYQVGNLFFAQLSLTGPRSHAGDRFKLILWSLPVSNLNIMIPGPGPPASLPYLPLALIRTGEETSYY